jgi:uncharacterized membrane protein
VVYVMNALSTIFSFLCHQNPARSFSIDGMLLPLCQRCTGLYVGMGISFIWLLAHRFYNKGLPPRSIIYINIASLLIMGVFGYHLLDPGPRWRLWSGLIFGNAVAFLILSGSSVVCNNAKALKNYTKSSMVSFFILFVFLNTIPFWFPIQSVYFHYLILTLIAMGLLCAPYCIISIVIVMIKKFVVSPILKGCRNEYAR